MGGSEPSNSVPLDIVMDYNVLFQDRTKIVHDMAKKC
jgi:hypothetical protein